MNTGHFTIRRVINHSPRREVIRILIHFPGNAYYGIFVDYIRINLLLFCAFILNLHIDPYSVCVSSGGSGETACRGDKNSTHPLVITSEI